MSVRTVNMLAQLFKDGQATPAERDIMLAAIESSSDLSKMTGRQRATLAGLRLKARRNIAKAKQGQQLSVATRQGIVAASDRLRSRGTT